MIRHTVSFALAHPADSKEERRFLTEGPALLKEIPGVQDFTVSRQVSLTSAYRFQFAMTFADGDAYTRYNTHPAHQNFVRTRWATEVTEFEELDFIDYP